MPKHDPMSAKAISNRQKTVGLQRLRWYCQMCQKQCRDENGFKCHTMSESHLRQMRVFADNPNSVLDEFSREFERGYLETLNSLHGTKRVKANTVYQEYIADKHHIHMNATIWTSLTGFCMHLGKESKAIVDETEKGWFIQYIDRDPKVLARQAQAEQRQKFELDEEERRKREIAAQVLAAEERVRSNGSATIEDTEVDNSLVRDDADQKIAVSLAPPVVASVGLKKRVRQCAGFGQDTDSEDEAKETKTEASAVDTIGLLPAPTGRGGGPSAAGGVLARMIQEEEQRKRARTHQQQATEEHLSASIGGHAIAVSAGIKEGALGNKENSSSSKQKDNSSSSKTASWLYKNLVVKVVSKEADKGRLYKLKGRVLRLLGREYDEAEVEMDHDGRLHRLHVRDLETTIPKVGQTALVVRGRGTGSEAEVLRIHEDRYCCDVRITHRRSELFGQELRGLEYEDICRYAPPSN